MQTRLLWRLWWCVAESLFGGSLGSFSDKMFSFSFTLQRNVTNIAGYFRCNLQRQCCSKLCYCSTQKNVVPSTLTDRTLWSFSNKIGRWSQRWRVRNWYRLFFPISRPLAFCASICRSVPQFMSAVNVCLCEWGTPVWTQSFIAPCTVVASLLSRWWC
jgi:hypothetical protein